MYKYFNFLGRIFLYSKLKFIIFKYKSYFTKRVTIDNTVKFYISNNNITISKGVTIGAYNIIYAINSKHSKISGKLYIGSRTSIGEFNNIRAAGGEIWIGEDCLISQFVTIVASNHTIISGKKINLQGWDEVKTGVYIGNDVWIGANVVILPGVNIGNGCVIAAGTVVTKSVPENSIVMGIPGIVVNKR